MFPTYLAAIVINIFGNSKQIIKNKMKKVFVGILLVITFIAGRKFEAWYYNFDSLYEANKFKRVLLEKHADALDKAAIVIDNNNLYDTDGSDAMSDYLIACEN